MEARYFNSQPHKEADGFVRVVFADYCFISTHSLTRRLTEILLILYTRQKHFNSQPHKEADGLKGDNGDGGKVFQLTASQGG